MSFSFYGTIFVLGTIIFDGGVGLISGYSREVIFNWFKNTVYLDRLSANIFFLLGTIVIFF